MLASSPQPTDHVAKEVMQGPTPMGGSLTGAPNREVAEDGKNKEKILPKKLAYILPKNLGGDCPQIFSTPKLGGEASAGTSA